MTPKLEFWWDKEAIMLRVLTERGNYHFVLGFRQLHIPLATTASNSYPYTMKQTIFYVLSWSCWALSLLQYNWGIELLLTLILKVYPQWNSSFSKYTTIQSFTNYIPVVTELPSFLLDRRHACLIPQVAVFLWSWKTNVCVGVYLLSLYWTAHY